MFWLPQWYKYEVLCRDFTKYILTSSCNSFSECIFRAPFGLFYHAAWFTQPHHKEGFIAFLDTIVNMQDVWLVTNWQAIQYVRDPTPLSRINSFPPFQCNYPVSIQLLLLLMTPLSHLPLSSQPPSTLAVAYECAAAQSIDTWAAT